MQNNDDIYNAHLKIIRDETINVSETNVLRDFIQISIKIFIILFTVYYTFIIITGIFVKIMPADIQLKLENIMTVMVRVDTVAIPQSEEKKLNDIKTKILNYDTKFPKTSKLNIGIIKNSNLNAYCLPNGNIYITSALYDKIKNDNEKLFFIIAHEMAHYKNRDHIMNLRKKVATFAVVLLTSLSTGNDKIGNAVHDSINLSDLNYSRHVESRADTYAAKMLLKEYNTAIGGKQTLILLENENHRYVPELLLTHPATQKRIKNIERIEQKFRH